MNVPLQPYWDLLATYLKPQRFKATLLGVLLLVSIGLRLVNPLIVRTFIDTALAGGALATLLNAALLFFGIALVNQGLSIANTYLSQDVAWTATNALRMDLLLHCLRLDQSFHKAHTPGALLERIDGDVNALSNFFSQFLIYILGNGLLLVGVLGLLFWEDWRIGLSLTLFVLLGLFIMIRIRSVAVPSWARVRQMSADFYGFLGEQLTGTEDIRANGATGYVMRRFHELNQRWFPLRTRAGMLGGSLWTTTVAIFALGNAIAFALGAYLWNTSAITIGTVYLIFYYTELLRRPMEQIRNQIEDLQQAEASIDRVRGLFATRSRLVDRADAHLPPGPLPVTCRAVSFGYDEQETVLRGITFALQPGRVLGLLGRTGSGKTTLARLLLRLYDAGAGEICLGGVRVEAVPLAQLRRRVAMVTQDVQLFQASVRDNLTFFNPAITDAHILAVLEELGLAPWLRSLPNGLDSELAGGGRGLSAGQAQLLAFARVFLADPGLVILDEASSRLDPATEQLIERAVSKLLHNRTGIIIAHRLNTVHRADEILILEKGTIVEYGPRRQLAQDPASRFAHLLQTGLEEVLA